ncbi:MAG: glycosyltransferase family 39 protein [Patescibacteria group bacterium]|jgi:hypothetical protein
MFPGHTDKLKNINLPNRYAYIVLIWLVLFIFYGLTAWKVLSLPVFSSPDETANYIFATQYKNTGQIPIPMDIYLPGSWRSIINNGQAFVPGSFTFFPALLGLIGKIFQKFGILMFGPALAATAIVCWWYFVKKITDNKASAWFAAVFLASLPIYWFYANRGLWQNGIFTSLLIINLYLLIIAWEKKFWPISLLTGVMWGTMVAIRPSEAVWLIVGLLVVLVINWRKLPYKQMLIAIIGGVLPLVILFGLQKQTYGNYLSIGYKPTSALEPSATLQETDSYHKLKNIFFPFGTDSNRAIKTFSKNAVKPLTYIFITGIVCLVWLLSDKKANKRTKYFIISGLVGGLALILLYGNYKFIEYPVSDEATLGSSYLRYWLPLFIIISFSFGWSGSRLFSANKFLKYLIMLATGIILGINLNTIWSSDIGIRQTFPFFKNMQEQSRWVKANTPENSVIIGNDKIVFPPRQAVGVNGGNVKISNFNNSLPELAPTYIFLFNTGDYQRIKIEFDKFKVDNLLDGPGGSGLVQITPK